MTAISEAAQRGVNFVSPMKTCAAGVVDTCSSLPREPFQSHFLSEPGETGGESKFELGFFPGFGNFSGVPISSSATSTELRLVPPDIAI